MRAALLSGLGLAIALGTYSASSVARPGQAEARSNLTVAPRSGTPPRSELARREALYLFDMVRLPSPS